MCDVPITGHAVERGVPESGPEHGSQGDAQSSLWALQGAWGGATSVALACPQCTAGQGGFLLPPAVVRVKD